MKNNIFKTRLVFTVLLFALAFAVPVSNTITEEVGITQTVKAKSKKKSKKPKKKGKVITIKKADKTTAKKIYTEGMKGKTFTIQYKCKSSSKKNISKGKKQLVKLCKSLDNYFPQFNTLGVNFKVTSALNIYKGDIKQSGRYVFVVINKGSENMDKFTCQRYALEVLPQLTSEWVQSKQKSWSIEYAGDMTKCEQFIKDYEAGLIKTKEDLVGTDYNYCDWGTLEESYNHTKSWLNKYYFDMAVIKAINEGKWINLDDPIRAKILSEAGMMHVDYNKNGSSDSIYQSHIALLKDYYNACKSGKYMLVRCGKYVHLHQTLWELTTFYNMDYNPRLEHNDNHGWGRCCFKTNSGQVVEFGTDNSGCQILTEPGAHFQAGYEAEKSVELYELYPDLNNIYHN